MTSTKISLNELLKFSDNDLYKIYTYADIHKISNEDSFLILVASNIDKLYRRKATISTIKGLLKRKPVQQIIETVSSDNVVDDVEVNKDILTTFDFDISPFEADTTEVDNNSSDVEVTKPTPIKLDSIESKRSSNGVESCNDNNEYNYSKSNVVNVKPIERKHKRVYLKDLTGEQLLKIIPSDKTSFKTDRAYYECIKKNFESEFNSTISTDSIRKFVSNNPTHKRVSK